MTAPVCYVQRTGSGSLIRGLRLVGDRLDAVWTPPVGLGSAADPGVAVEQTRAAARWVAENLPGKGPRTLSNVCVDVDGGLCLWLSAPSADPSVVAAAMVQGRSPDDPSSGADGSATSLLAMASAGVGMERSVQALEPPEPAGGGGAFTRSRKAPLQRRRMAVLSVPDLTVRVFLDELDALGVEVETVTTFWHAISAAWDPDRPAPRHGFSGVEERIASSQPTCAAVVVLDPGEADDAQEAPGGGGARLTWSWTIGGELLAGGTLRLRSVTTATAPPAGAQASDALTLEGARRLEQPAPVERSIVCGAAEAGRLIADWLAWSAQLGVSPTRILCVGPIPMAETELGQPEAGLVELLARRWNGATVDAAVYHDPVGATLERLGVPSDDPGESVADPRSALIALSHRPGRAHRSMYFWAAAAITLGAAAVGALGWRLGVAAKETSRAASGMQQQMQASLAGLSDIVPNIAQLPGVGMAEPLLTTTLQSLQQNRPRLDYERPALSELGRLLEAIDIQGVSSELKLDTLQINSVGGTVVFILPADDALSGQLITAQLQRRPGEIVWTGEGRAGAAGQNTRTWTLNGAWVPRAPDSGRLAGAAGGAR